MEEQPQNGGLPCPEENIVSTTCSERPCDLMDCSLSEWGAWSSCSRACGGGLRQRTRALRPVNGGAEGCPKLEEEQGIQYHLCNNETCPTNSSALSCAAKLDVAIVLDGGGGCGPEGFAETKEFMQALVKALDVGADNTQVALVVAGGVPSFEAYERCLQGGTLGDCNVKLAMPLSSDAAGVSLVLNTLTWSGGPGHLAGALAHAGAVLGQMGRKGVPPVVLVVTHGRPLSISRTLMAADALRPTVRVAWLLVGEDAPKEEATKWASQPTRDNVLQITSPPGLAPGSGSGGRLAVPGRISQIIAAICPKVTVPS